MAVELLILLVVFVALIAVTFRTIHSHRGENDRRATVHLNGRTHR